MKKKVSVLGISVSVGFGSLLVLLVVACVFLTIKSAASGAKLASLEMEIISYQEKNQQLTNQLVMASSLTEIAQKAEELELIEPEDVVYLTLDKSVAQLPR
jgi:hypothetical protein